MDPKEEEDRREIAMEAEEGSIHHTHRHLDHPLVETGALHIVGVMKNVTLMAQGLVEVVDHLSPDRMITDRIVAAATGGGTTVVASTDREIEVAMDLCLHGMIHAVGHVALSTAHLILDIVAGEMIGILGEIGAPCLMTEEVGEGAMAGQNTVALDHTGVGGMVDLGMAVVEITAAAIVSIDKMMTTIQEEATEMTAMCKAMEMSQVVLAPAIVTAMTEPKGKVAGPEMIPLIDDYLLTPNWFFCSNFFCVWCLQ